MVIYDRMFQQYSIALRNHHRSGIGLWLTSLAAHRRTQRLLGLRQDVRGLSSHFDT